MSTSSKINRNIRLSAPYTRGEDVKALQRGVNARLAARGRKGIKVDGVWGMTSAHALRRALWFLGAPSNRLDDGATTYMQRVVRDPFKNRPRAWESIAADRKRWLANSSDEAKSVVAWAKKWVGTHEVPANSNRGVQIDVWQREVHMLAAPWCGAFVIFGLRHIAGIAVPDAWRFTPNILADAHMGKYGCKLVPIGQARPGDVLLFDFKAGGDPVMHTGFKGYANDTIEGNTSSDNKGSQDNGGGVYVRKWSERKQFCVGVVRPPYGK